MKKTLKLTIYLFLLIFLFPFAVSAKEDNLTIIKDGVKVSVTDTKNKLPDNAAIELTKGSFIKKAVTQREAVRELESMEGQSDGSFISQMYEDAKIKNKTSYLYSVRILYNEDGEEKEYIPKPDDGISISFSVDNRDFSEAEEELDVFRVDKTNATLIQDSVTSNGEVEVKATENGQYLILALDYIANAGSSEKEEAERKSYELMGYVDPEYHLTDEFSNTYDDAQFAEMKAGAEAAIEGKTTDYEKISALSRLVATRTYYDYPYVENGESLTALNPYDVWTKRITVCDGYSRLMKTLSNAVGIPCMRIYSDNHAYNACYDSENRRWIVLDTTWSSGNKYTTDKEMRAGAYRDTFFDMGYVFMASLSNHEVFSLSGILYNNVYYANYPNYYAENWSGMDWSTWTDMTDWHLKVTGKKTGTQLQAEEENIAELPVTEVQSRSMQYSDLTSVSLPQSIIEIETSAFYGSSSLETVSVPGSGSIRIGDYAFKNNSSLRTADIGQKTISSIGTGAFSGDSELETFGDDDLEVGEIEGDGLRGCASLTDNVTVTGDTIERSAFYDCSNIKGVDCSGSGADKIGEYAFRGCEGLESLKLPQGIEEIPQYLCYNCKSLREAEIPVAKIKKVGRSAFYGCENLTAPSDWSKATFTSLPDYAFYKNGSLGEIILPATVTSIGYASLGYCSGIKEVNFSNTGIETIGDYAMYGMNFLERIRMPGTLRSSGSRAYSKTSEGILDTYVIGTADQEALNYTGNNNGAWSNRKLIFAAGMFKAVFINDGNIYKEKQLPINGTVTFPEMTETKDHYSFKGWNDGNGNTYPSGSNAQINAEDMAVIEFQSLWSPVDYQISYYLNGGSGNNNPDTYNIESEDIQLTAPSREHYDFTGWYKTGSLEEKIETISKGSYGDMTLYAGWQCKHDQTTTSGAREPTCAEEGYTGDIVCSICGNTIQNGTVIEKAEHVPGEAAKENIEGNPCVEDISYDLVTRCANCGGIITTEHKTEAKAGHKWDEGIIRKKATCKETGIKVFTCAVCHEEREETIPVDENAHSKEHDLVNKKEATCQEEGYTGDEVCRYCGQILKQGSKTEKDTDNHPESRIDGKKEATCTDDGYTGDTICSLCGTIIRAGNSIKCTGHKWDKGKVTKEATCTAEGTKLYTCSVCHGTKEEKIPVNSTHSQALDIKGHIEAACDKAGYTGDGYCKNCHKKVSSGTVIPAAGHKWTLSTTIPATEQAPGKTIYQCVKCGTKKEETIPQLLPTPVALTGLKIQAESTKIAEGKKVRLTVTAIPENAADKSVTWISGNRKIAVVDRNGVVKFNKKTGGKKVTITAVSRSNSAVKASVRLTSMKGQVKSIKLKAPKVIKAGKSYKITAAVKASPGANKKLMWTSNNPGYVTVKNGKIRVLKTAKNKKVKITALSTDGTNKKATVTLKVR